MNTPRIQVVLRESIDSDLEPLFEISQDPQVNELAKVYPRSRESFEAQWEEVHNDPTIVARTILCDGEVVGKINSFPFEGQHNVGYWISRAYWGKGIGTIALRMFLELVDTRPLIARVATTNIGSCRMLERCGFEQIEESESPATERYMACIQRVYMLS